MRVHFNGSLVEADEARVSVFDRGFLFGDGVYEGLRTTAGRDGVPRVIGLWHHEQRLAEGLRECRLSGFDAASLGPLTEELVRGSGLVEAFVYWQITRGTPAGAAGPERPRVPRGPIRPTVLGYATAVRPVAQCTEPEVKRVALRPDTRWLRGHVKSISLLGGVLAAFEADELGCDDAVMVRDGLVTEGTATNVFLHDGRSFVTPSLESAPMLAGVTRRLLVDHGVGGAAVVERPVREAELRAAPEVMLVGTKTMVASVVSIDGAAVGDGRPGPRARELLAALVEAVGRDVNSAGSAARSVARV
ncbi:MAG: aminotransferase class IV [Planctomycetota bacterium]|nr:aminotransferase class IV [Planctomycetota bacterium]